MDSKTRHACSTFLLSTPDAQMVGHNLDDYIEVPGQIIVNPRGIAKENISWKDLTGFRIRWRPRVQWTSKYGSITCNMFGREFPDGGMNEAGLFVGEMTLLGTKYPQGQGLPKIYHYQWMQYILDNFETVEQVLASLSMAVIDGHCQWHFFTADKLGNAAVLEFLDGKTIIHTGEQMPVKVLANTAYAEELANLAKYEGFGGTKPVDFSTQLEEGRFEQAAAMLQQYAANPRRSPVEEAFAILAQLKRGNNKWSLVFDPRQMRLYFNTYRAGEIKYVDFSAFDLSGVAPAMTLGIHRRGSGEVSGQFQAFSKARNRSAITEAWGGIDMGKTYLNLLFKPWLVHKLSSYPSRFWATTRAQL